MTTHSFWGKIDCFSDYGGFGSEKDFKIPFGEKQIIVNLGPYLDEDGEEIETPPNQTQLDDF